MTLRKNQASMSPAEKTAFVNAMLALKAAPSIAGNPSRFDDFVAEHIESMTGGNEWAHRRPAFLPWHREYLRRMELALQAIDPAVFIPYWDWTVDNSTAASLFDASFMGGDGDPANNDIVPDGPFSEASGNWPTTLGPTPQLRRRMGRPPGPATLPTGPQVANCLLETPYDEAPWDNSGTLQTLRNRLEGFFGAGSIHNRVHNWVGGSMGPESSPNDPLFWLHHCNIDRLWAQWQRLHPIEDYHPQGTPGDTGPAGHNLNDSMLPWGGAATPASTLDHHAMGYWYDDDPGEITLVTPSLAFTDVPEGLGGSGQTTYRPIVFEVVNYSPVTLQITAGPSGGFATTPLGTIVSLPLSDGITPTVVRLWIAYTSTNAGDVANGSVTVAEAGTSNQWTISLTANTIARPRTAIALALDRSGSMSGDAGDGTTKHEKLLEAVEVFVQTMIDGDGLSIIGYDNIVDRHFDVTDVGPIPAAPGSGRALANALLAGSALDPRGATAIGSAVQEAQDALDDGQAAAADPYDALSIVVLTDGIENVAPFVNTVLPGISASTYAVGLGTPSTISTAALDALATATGKYLLVTGVLDDEQRFRLIKFFVQILAGITGAQIVLDPRGDLVFGPTHRIAFHLGAADYAFDAILTSPLAQVIDFRLEAPDGSIIDPSLPASDGVFSVSTNAAFFRIPLPLRGLHKGQWRALLTLNEERIKALLAGKDEAGRDRERILREIRSGSVPYSFMVHAYSTLAMHASLASVVVRLGEAAGLSVALTESGIPVEGRVRVFVDVRDPAGAEWRVDLGQTAPGSFGGKVMTTAPGVHVLRVRAVGSTLLGTPFTREQTLTVAAVRGTAEPRPRMPEAADDAPWLDLLECVLGKADGAPFGIPAEVLRDCVKRLRKRRRPDRIQEAPVRAARPRLGAKEPARLDKPAPPPKFPPVHMDHDGDTMFPLSPQDQAEEDKRTREDGSSQKPR